MLTAIIDDNQKELDYVSLYIENELKKYSIHYTIDKSNDPLLLDFNKYYDVLFLDIDMPKDGILLAKEYLANHRNTKIIFITSHIERVLDTFDVHSYYVIHKSNILETLPSVIESLITEIDDNKFISINTENGLIEIPLNKIKYIESDKHYCIINTINNEYTTRNKLDTINKMITSNDFCRIRNNAIVNWNYVDEFKNKDIKIGNIYINVSRSYITNTKASYLDYIHRTI